VIKLLNWATKVIMQTMIIVTLTICLTWIAVHTYVDKLLSTYHIDTAESKIQFSDFLSHLSLSLNILKPSALNKQAASKTAEPNQSSLTEATPTRLTLPETPVNEAAPSPSASSLPSASPTPSVSPTNAKSTGTEAAPDDTVPVWNQTSNESNMQETQSGKKDLVMSAEQFTKKKDQLSEADKMKIFTLLATRLPEAEFQKISKYVEDGVTEEEWLAIQALVEKFVKPEEYKELQDVLARY
jgi:hypothetical protein